MVPPDSAQHLCPAAVLEQHAEGLQLWQGWGAAWGQRGCSATLERYSSASAPEGTGDSYFVLYDRRNFSRSGYFPDGWRTLLARCSVMPHVPTHDAAISSHYSPVPLRSPWGPAALSPQPPSWRREGTTDRLLQTRALLPLFSFQAGFRGRPGRVRAAGRWLGDRLSRRGSRRDVVSGAVTPAATPAQDPIHLRLPCEPSALHADRQDGN